jgi:putrescine transport system substrate-binding protein
LAELFINYILDGDVGRTLSAYLNSASPNQATLDKTAQSVRNNPWIYPPLSLRQRLFYLTDISQQAAQIYTDAWAEIMKNR